MIAALLLALAAPDTVPPVDPLTATVETSDVDRFAAIFDAASGVPTAADLQRGYLDPGSEGVRVFTPDRIESAAHLAKAVAADRAGYERALRVCLPIVRETQGELRATYLALHGLLPDQSLPRIFLVIGAGNSGGTAAPGVQVLGLEVLCRISETPEALRATLRSFYAHETVHALQHDPDGALAAANGNVLLQNVLVEGAADFIATLVTGRQIDPERAAWGIANERMLWTRFDADLALVQGSGDLSRGKPAGDALYRWIGNAGDPPTGWKSEAGYWVGQRIWQRWYDRQSDKHAAIHRMLTLDRLNEILAVGRYGG
ncbi:hypothetical protein SAMN05216382_2601 [Sphingomonas palmae]|uniref:DUF2268 domain-containing protein n=1 Tax=Sphingomonas palmae TaxID=1855283 RepID=A0A1H7SYB8_9SPHN|nr:hypothetical protein [Sphingomonas palmae]SEL77239.1 hypothetical protein SAMN05216382_2601 [Sphingomonas palmae]